MEYNTRMSKAFLIILAIVVLVSAVGLFLLKGGDQAGVPKVEIIPTSSLNLVPTHEIIPQEEDNYTENTQKKTEEEDSIVYTATPRTYTYSPPVSSSGAGLDLKNGDISWSFNALSTGKTAVTLKVKDKTYQAGSYEGNCTSRTKDLFPQEVSPYVTCLSNGVGVELGVFLENSKFVLKKGTIQKDNQDYYLFRGYFERIFDL